MTDDEDTLAYDYVDGRNARRAGRSLNECDPSTPRGREWHQGWVDCNRDLFEEDIVKHTITFYNLGYGQVMQIASEQWRLVAKEKGLEGSELTIGPCAQLLVPCTCESGCDWCEGTRKVTKRVRQAIDESSK